MGCFNHLFVYIIFGFALAPFHLAEAQTLSYERPTVAELLADLPAPSNASNALAESDLVSIRTRLPEIIATLERAHPGLVYVFLGRDTAFLADLIDGFYLSLGQPGRVIRLEASTDTIKNAKPEQLMALLGTNGFRPRNGRGLERPFVFLDRTLYSDESQSTLLASTAFRWLLASGLTVEKALQQVSVVNLGSRDLQSVMTLRGRQSARYDRRELILDRAWQPGFGSVRLRQSAVLNVPAVGLIDREDLSWHGTFGELRMTEDARLGGRVFDDQAQNEREKSAAASKGQPYIPTDWIAKREKSLRTLRHALGIVTGDEFRRTVQSKLGSRMNFEPASASVVRNSSEAAVALDTLEPTAREAALDFLDRSRLSLARRRDLLERVRWNSDIYRKNAELLLSEAWSPVGAKAIELILTFDTLRSLPQGRTDQETNSLRSRLETRAINIIERIGLVDAFEHPERAQVALQSVGALIQDVSTQIDEATLSRIEARWRDEIPRLTEQGFESSKLVATQARRDGLLIGLGVKPGVADVINTTTGFTALSTLFLGIGPAMEAVSGVNLAALDLGTTALDALSTGFYIGGAAGAARAAVTMLFGRFRGSGTLSNTTRVNAAGRARLQETTAIPESADNRFTNLGERRILSCPQSLVPRRK